MKLSLEIFKRRGPAACIYNMVNEPDAESCCVQLAFNGIVSLILRKLRARACNTALVATHHS